jgi:hypothetical protein
MSMAKIKLNIHPLIPGTYFIMENFNPERVEETELLTVPPDHNSVRQENDEEKLEEVFTEPVLLKQILAFSNAVHQFDFELGIHREDRRDGLSFYITSLFLNIIWMSIYFIGTKLQGTCSHRWLILNSPMLLLLCVFDIVLYIYAYKLIWIIKLKMKKRNIISFPSNPIRTAKNIATVKLLAYKVFCTLLRITIQFLCFTLALDFPKYRLFSIPPFILANFILSFQTPTSNQQNFLKKLFKKNYHSILRISVFSFLVFMNFKFLGSLPLYYYWVRHFLKSLKAKFNNGGDQDEDVEENEMDQMDYGDAIMNFCLFLIMFGIHVKQFADSLYTGFPFLSYHLAFAPIHFLMAVVNTGFAGLLD